MNPDTVLQDLQDVMGMQSNKRQGEVLAMLELGLELFSSTLSQSNLALKVELTNAYVLMTFYDAQMHYVNRCSLLYNVICLSLYIYLLF